MKKTIVKDAESKAANGGKENLDAYVGDYSGSYDVTSGNDFAGTWFQYICTHNTSEYMLNKSIDF